MAATGIEHDQLWFLDTLVTVRVAHAEGEDGVSVLESLAPHGDSPPLHVHHTEDEVFHVLEGEFRFRVGESHLRLRAGETLLAPKGVPHTYCVESPSGGRWLVVTTHGDFERLVRSFSRPARRRRCRSPRARRPPSRRTQSRPHASSSGSSWSALRSPEIQLERRVAAPGTRARGRQETAGVPSAAVPRARPGRPSRTPAGRPARRLGND